MTDPLPPIRRGSRAWRVAGVLALVFLFGHLPFLASTLEDVDSVNFALGLRDFDPGRHRPHPPGYPLYMALGKAANLVLSEPRALAFWGALFGALSAFALLRLFAALDALDGALAAPLPDRPAPRIAEWLGRPAVTTMFTMLAPLFWMTASRPMSDTAGLGASLTAQAILLTAMVRQRLLAFLGNSSGKVVNWISSQSVPEMLPPCSGGSTRSRLLTLLEKGHQGIKLSREELEKIACWIDLLVPYCGDFLEANAWSQEEITHFERYAAKRRRMEEIEQANIREFLARIPAISSE